MVVSAVVGGVDGCGFKRRGFAHVIGYKRDASKETREVSPFM